MSSSSPTKPPSIPSRSSSQLSLDSHLSSPRKRHSESSSIGSRRSIDQTASGESRRSSVISHAHEGHHQAALSPHMRMASGFAVKVGIGSPKLDFGRRDWIGGVNKEGNASADKSPTEPTLTEEQHYQGEGNGKQTGNTLVDRVSGLPSPPGTESDIAPPSAGSSRAKATSGPDNMARGDKTLSSSSSITPKSPTRAFRRTSSTGSAQLLARKSSSRSSSTSIADASPKLRTTTIRPKHSPSLSMSRSASSSSSLVTSPLAGAKSNGSLSGSTRKSSAEISRSSSHSSSLSLGGQPGSASRKANLAPLDTRRANSPSSKFSSPERTAKKLPSVSSSIGQMVERKAARRLSRDSYVEALAEEEDGKGVNMSRSRSHGSELDDKIREAEERIAGTSHGRRKRSIDIEKSTPVRGQIRRHDSYTRVTGSPLVASSSASVRRSATMSSASAPTHNPDSPAESLPKKGDMEMLRDEGQEDREKSGGSSSSRRRKALPADFRNTGLFTPSPQKPVSKHIDEPLGSARSSRLKQFIDSPVDHSNSSPLPSRFSTASRRSGEREIIASPSRADRYIAGLERSASMVGMRGGDSSGYARRNWSQSISGLPRAGDDIDSRGLPRDRYRAESVMGGLGERSTYGPKASLDAGITPDRAVGRRGMSTLVSERDLLAASRSRLGSIAPGDSVSAVGVKSERGDNKDPLEVIRRLEEQRAQSKQRWDHMPRPVTSMSSLRDSYNHPPNSAPIDGLRHRRSIDQDSPLSPTYRVGSRAGLRGPSTEPRPMRSSTSVGGKTSAGFDLGSSTTEHGRLLFEAFRVLESKVGQDILSSQPEMLRSLYSATRTSENINTILRNALHLASQIAVDAELDDPVRVREEYSNLALLLREAGKSSESNVRDMTRILLDLPKIVRHQQNPGSTLTASTSGGSGLESGRLRRSESASLSYAYNPATQGVMSEDRARRWQPSSPSTVFDRSPLQGRWSIDSPRRRFDVVRAPTSIGDAYSPLSRYSRERDRANDRAYEQEQEKGKEGVREREKSGGHGSTVSSLMSKVRAMTPRKATQSPRLDLSTIEASPPQGQTRPRLQTSQQQQRSQLDETPDRMRHILKKKASSMSTNTVKGSNFMPSTSGGKATTAISQVTAGDLSPTLSGHGAVGAGNGIGLANIVPDEPNSPMSRFSFRSQRGLSKTAVEGRHTRNSSAETDEGSRRGHTRDSSGDNGCHEHEDHRSQGQSQGYEDSGQSYETDAVSLLAQRLAQADKARDGDVRRRGPSSDSTGPKNSSLSGLGIAPGQGHEQMDREDDGASVTNGNKRPSISDRFRASLRKGSRLE
ncbi:hypothetical protein I317_04409 [Kwoniella heveanensis CBS 569]|nr:hypothetical protein I317_04409 [Kwoniella heveanensis CBS 569]